MSPPLLGRYQLEVQVGQGGMAVVWRGLDLQLRRTVAVKILHPHLNAREEIRKRFDREARAVARLHHPHIIDVFDFQLGDSSAPAFLVTEFVPGTSLRHFRDAHPFAPPELGAACVLSLAEALEHAHEAGVVHRDIKPENVMVRDDGAVKLTDFGLAALLEPDEKFTVTGTILGSPAHMAPETLDGKPIDKRSDLFSLGTLLYWLVCGRLPFQAPTPGALLRQILESQPADPRTLQPAVSDELAALIMRLLARDPDQRVQSAGQLRQELAALLQEVGIDDPRTELAAFLRGAPPEAVGEQLRQRLVAHAFKRAEEAGREGRTGAALSLYARVLNLEPGNSVAAARLAVIRQRARRRRRLKQLSGTALLLAASGLGAAQLVGLRRSRERAAEPPGATVETTAPPPIIAPHPAAALPTTTSAAAPPGTPPVAAQPPAPEESAGGAPSASSGSAPASPAGQPPTSALPAPAPAPGELLARPLQHRQARARQSEPSPAPRAAGPATVQATLAVHWVWGRVTLDGVDLGEQRTFTRELAVGPHQVTVSHACCLDNTQTIDVEPHRTRYQLEPGTPRPAGLSVINAPADVPVLIDGVPMGTSSHLAEQQLPMTQGPLREVLVTVGDRSGSTTLQAGRVVPVDFLKLKQASAP